MPDTRFLLAIISLLCTVIFIVLGYYFARGQLYCIDPDISVMLIICSLGSAAICGATAAGMHIRRTP